MPDHSPDRLLRLKVECTVTQSFGVQMSLYARIISHFTSYNMSSVVYALELYVPLYQALQLALEMYQVGFSS